MGSGSTFQLLASEVLTDKPDSLNRRRYMVIQIQIPLPSKARTERGTNIGSSVVPARLGLKAAALAWPEAALASSNPGPGQSHQSQLGLAQAAASYTKVIFFMYCTHVTMDKKVVIL